MNELKLNVIDNSAASPSAAKNTYGKFAASAAKAVNVTGGNELPQKDSKASEASPEQVREAVSRINEYVQQNERTLDFQLDETSGQTIIRVYDKHSSELIRQIPSELALELAQKLNDEEPTLLFSAQV